MNKKLIIVAIAIIILICAGAFAFTNSNQSTTSSVSIDANGLEDRGNLVVDSKSLDESKGLYHTDAADTNAILVKNEGALKLADSIINKTGDTATSGDDADFYGVNSAVLVNTNGTLDISNVEINTNSKGSNGIFVTNANASSNGDSSQGSQTSDAQGGAIGQPPEATGNGGDNSQGGAGGQPPEMPSGEGGQAPGTVVETHQVQVM